MKERLKRVVFQSTLGSMELFFICHGVVQTIYVLIRGFPVSIPVNRAGLFYGIIGVFTAIRFFAFVYQWMLPRRICAFVFFVVWVYISSEFYVSRLDSFSFSVMLALGNLWLMVRLGIRHRLYRESINGLKQSTRKS